MTTHALSILGQPLVITVENGSGSIQSGLQREVCPCCNQPDCNRDCDGSKSDLDDVPQEQEEDVIGWLQYNAALDALESLVLAHACSGIAIADPRYVEGVKTTLQALGNSL